LSPSSMGQLKWNGLRLGSESSAQPPQTSERVWLAPRNVASTPITTADGKEAEKYLFYRGVGHLDAPLVVRQQDRRVHVALRSGENAPILKGIPASWLVRVFPDGRVWYLAFGGKSAAQASLQLPADEAASHANLKALQAALRDALIAQGLFGDEAQAMIETWELSYFKSEGLRVFSLLPRSWTDHYLTVSLSTAASITRVMLGRVELISPFQQQQLAKLYAATSDSARWTPAYIEILTDFGRLPPEERERETKRYWTLESGGLGHAGLYEAFGKPVPEELKLYDSLGRFRDALLAHELKQAKDDGRKAKAMNIIRRFSACLPAEAYR
jgi:hypothetical protein